MASIYVHFPWCLAKCPYCDFVSYASERDAIDHVGYADAVIRDAETRAAQLEQTRPEGHPLTIGSVFFGGGTPSLWDAPELGRVLARLREIWSFAGDVEVTVECNPTSLDGDRARALVDVGANRLSIGTQSLRAEQLEFLGRLHDPAGARAAVAAAIAVGVPRVSTDLIFGLPGQTPDDAREQATTLTELGLSHLSCYQLTIEPGTQFGERRKRGLLPMADEGAVAESFLAIDEALAGRGFAHYEISNYAEPGQEARHNVAYWRGDEYIGLGVAAFGFVQSRSSADEAAGLRWRNAIVPKDYVDRTVRARARTSRTTTMTGIAEDDGITITAERLSADALLRERIMLGLRMAEGVDLARAASDLGIDPWTTERARTVTSLVERGRLTRDGDVLRVPRTEWVFTDDIVARLF